MIPANIAARIAELQAQGYGRIERRQYGPHGYIRDPAGGARRSKAHALVQKALTSGALQRGPCEECGDRDTVAHHDDYAEPLAVRWLCGSHHREWHRKHGEAANP